MASRLPLHPPPARRPSLPPTLAAAALALVLATPGRAAAPRPAATPRPTPRTSAPTLPALSVTGFSLAEGNSGSTSGIFVIGLTARSTRAITVDYETHDGTAIAASGDYRRTAGRLTIDAGATSATVEVPIRGDTVEEPDETFVLAITHATGARIAVAQATGEIVDDDGGAGPGTGPALSIRDARVSEGDGDRRQVRFVVTLSSPVRHEVSVEVSTADGSATPWSSRARSAPSSTAPPRPA